eukprot:g44877.t1
MTYMHRDSPRPSSGLKHPAPGFFRHKWETANRIFVRKTGREDTFERKCFLKRLEETKGRTKGYGAKRNNISHHVACVTMPYRSCLYSGTVSHSRDREVAHSFTYPVMYFCLDLAELASNKSPFKNGLLGVLSKTGVVSFNPDDHIRLPAVEKAVGRNKAKTVMALPLLDKVRAVIALKTAAMGHTLSPDSIARVQLLANVRYFGYDFNPISIFYCYNDAQALTYMLLEVSNTPWRETHLYLLGPHSPDSTLFSASKGSRHTSGAKFGPYRFRKTFHVSPFMPMADQVYRLEACMPGKVLSVEMGTLKDPELQSVAYPDDLQFEANLRLQRHELSHRNLSMLLLKHANMTHATQFWIHKEAMELNEKGVTFFPHPEGSTTAFSKVVERLVDVYNLAVKPTARSAIAHTRDAGPNMLQLEARAALVAARAAQAKQGGTLAVIGSGIAGLSAAYFAQLQSPYNVVLYEAADKLGGHALTYEVLPGVKIDLGFQVYNLTNYPYLGALFRALNVESIESDMSLSVQRTVADQPSQHTEWASHGLGAIFPKWSDMMDLSKVSMIKEMLRFNRECPKVVEPNHPLRMLSVGEYMKQEGYSQEFLELYLLPACGAIWSVSFKQVLAYPIRSLAGFFNNHHLFSLIDRPQWRTPRFRSEDYVNKLAHAFVEAGGKFRVSSAVSHVSAVETGDCSLGSEPSEASGSGTSSDTSSVDTSDSDKEENTAPAPVNMGAKNKNKMNSQKKLSSAKSEQKIRDIPTHQGGTRTEKICPQWLIRDVHDETLVVDRVIFACHPQQAAEMLMSRVCPAELVQLAGTLQRMPYSNNKIKVHTDESVMPKNRKLWAAWNCHVVAGPDQDSQPIGVSYWMNKLQLLPPQVPQLFVTLNSPEPDPAKVLHTLELEHPILNHSALTARDELQEKNGELGLYFCGAWAKHGFHEDGIQSAVQTVSKLLGKDGPAVMKFLPEPWHVISSPADVPLKYRALVPTLASYIEGLVREGHLCMVLPNGQEKHFVGQPRKLHNGQPAQVSLFIHKWEFLGSLVWDVDMAMAEGYMEGAWSVTPDLTSLIEMMAHNATLMQKDEANNRDKTLSWKAGLAKRLISAGQMVGESLHHFENLLRRNTLSQSVSNIASHYDLGNDMYSLFLDKTMTYSAAYFETPQTSLYDAQLKKLDMILDKARLPREGEFKVLEIGCGWASCALRALERNAKMHWTGVTISEEQLRLGRDRVASHQLEGKIDLKFLDYRHAVREMGEASFDAVVSIEMIEAVGGEFLPHYFETIFRALKPGGLGVVQAITVPNYRYKAYVNSSDFIRQHIFPGGELVSIAKCVESFPTNPSYKSSCDLQYGEKAGSLLRVIDVQELGQHYARTLLCWLKTWEEKKLELLALGISEVSWRLWKYYFCYCAGGFLAGHIDVIQLVVERPKDTAGVSVSKPLIEAPVDSSCPASSMSLSSSVCPVTDAKATKKVPEIHKGALRLGLEKGLGLAARTVFPVFLGVLLLLHVLFYAFVDRGFHSKRRRH